MKKKQYEELLQDIIQKPPRAGVHPTKIHKDKSKYSRKDKHKKKIINGEE